MAEQYEEVLHPSIEACLRDSFGCDIIKHQCIVAIEQIGWKGYTIDVVGYVENEGKLYIVEAKNNTWLGSSGVSSAIGQIMMYMASLKQPEVETSLRKYSGIGDRTIKSIFLYLAFPNFEGESLEKQLHPPALEVIKGVREWLSGRLGLLEVAAVGETARVVQGFEAEPFDFHSIH